MSDAVPEVKFDEPVHGEYDPDVEVFVEGVDQEPVVEESKDEGPSKDELVRELEESRRREEALARQADSTLAMRQGLKELKEAVARPVQAPKDPQETEEEFNNRLKENILDNTGGVLKEFAAKKIGPYVDRLAETNMVLAKRLTKLEKGESFTRYESEIDKEAMKMDRSDPDVYAKAHDLVVSRHLGDERSRMEEEIMERVRKEFSGSTKSSVEAPFTPSGDRSSPPPVKKGKRLRLTKEENAIAEREAFRIGMDPKKYKMTKFGDRL